MNALNLFEANIILWIQENLRVGFLTPVMQGITTLGDGGVFWIILSVLLLLFKKTRKVGICCALGLIFDLLVVNIAVKPLVARVRPYEVIKEITILTHQPGDHSFPSGHSAGSFACAWAFFRAYKKKWGVPALVLASLIAISRLYVGVHYPTDVIGGIVIGIIVGELGYRVGKKIWRAIMRKKKAARRRASR
ncbi:MAG: phosphatase PAP2 family protein [Clostridia bacterium]|nr:phosphatase PAP2 family protein [Clostridia bacterium]MBP3652224.1 phosphatase PAP2 family protein [Clostridia bacterium]